jgi:hypothetical protein
VSVFDPAIFDSVIFDTGVEPVPLSKNRRKDYRRTTYFSASRTKR